MNGVPSSVEEAFELFLERRRRGELLDPAAFAAQYPELGPLLPEALEALVAIELAAGSEVMPGLLPDRVGTFRIVREIGRGGMGVVLEAVEEPLGRRVALKVLPPELLSSPQARARFRREAELAARVDHSGIATVYGAGVEADQPWIAMRYVEGRTLSRSIAEARKEGSACVRLAPEGTSEREAALAVARLCAKVARALQAAHEHGVVHRDVKPSNIMVAPDGTPVLLDFGLAIAETQDGRSLTRTGHTAGTPAYLPPETVGGEVARPDAQGDVYSLGVAMYECLALRRPFEAPTHAALYRAILSAAPADLRRSNRAVPRDLAVVVATAMERDRARRYRSAAALADDLEACVAGRPIAARPVPPLGRALRWVRREPRLALATAAAILIAIGGLAWVSIVQSADARDIARKNEDLSAANLGLLAAKEKAESNARIAAQKADDVLSLSAMQDLQELVDQADRLWPAEPEKIPEFEAWLRDARVLIDGRPADEARAIKAKPGLADHRRKLAELEARAGAESDDRWWRAQLTKLVAELEAFSNAESGLAAKGLNPGHGWGVERRLETARTIEARSIEGPDAKERWYAAIASIQDRAGCPAYDGLELAPQRGLLPIGEDPASGLWEFAHLESGEPAVRGPDGKLTMREGTGLVLVLLPGGKFFMGAQKSDANGTNYDPQASADEGPVSELTLGPFFLSKYEMTQDQWLRITGKNPSAYHPGNYYGGKAVTLLHPVEQVSWSEATRILDRFGLRLPTEAQWEYAARAGTSTSWWTGEEKASVRGAANLADGFYKSHGGPTSIPYEEWLEDEYAVHAPVGSYRANAFGLHDTMGNVFELCRDAFGKYDASVRPGDGERTVEKPISHMIRGGSFRMLTMSARSARRLDVTPDYSDFNLGVRPARGIAPR
jgi:formylglycine-generating enzyme required for sulfatase activity